MLLCVDIGNSNIVVGLFSGQDLCLEARISTDPRRTADEYGLWLGNFLRYHGREPSEITAAAISNVVPPLRQPFSDLFKRFFQIEPLFVGPGVKTGVSILTENPKEVGSDLIVAEVAASVLYGKPNIVIDFGTATTFTAVSSQGEFLGAAIAPGLTISADALFAQTARLPRIEMVFPKSAIGRNTVWSMQSGILLGFLGLVEHLTDAFIKEMAPSGPKPVVVATGGLAGLIAPHTRVIDEVDPVLILSGLRIIHEMNCEG
ncbi:MAG: type III pantothenate kinase [Armatimonadetes bacterium]|nr:type III pantothenate kinase [Armatimonadota bacterium]